MCVRQPLQLYYYHWLCLSLLLCLCHDLNYSLLYLLNAWLSSVIWQEVLKNSQWRYQQLLVAVMAPRRGSRTWWTGWTTSRRRCTTSRSTRETTCCSMVSRKSDARLLLICLIRWGITEMSSSITQSCSDSSPLEREAPHEKRYCHQLSIKNVLWPRGWRMQVIGQNPWQSLDFLLKIFASLDLSFSI